MPEGALALFHRAAVCKWIPLCLGTVAFERPGPAFPEAAAALRRFAGGDAPLRFSSGALFVCAAPPLVFFTRHRSCGGLSAWAALPGFFTFSGAALRLCSGAAVLLSLLRCLRLLFRALHAPAEIFFMLGGLAFPLGGPLGLQLQLGKVFVIFFRLRLRQPPDHRHGKTDIRNGRHGGRCAAGRSAAI